MDLFFEEDGQLVLVDYKTDVVPTPEALVDRYKTQVDYYQEALEKLTGKKVKFYKGDILDRDILNHIFETEQIDSCIHFAGLKAVGESVAMPWEYYQNNIAGTLVLVDVMRQHNCKNIIISKT